MFPEFKQLCLDFFDPQACFHHFRSMATGNFADFRDSKDLPFKKYFYVMRSLLCARYIFDHQRPAPCNFVDLLDEYYPSGDVRDEINQMLAAMGRSSIDEVIDSAVPKKIRLDQPLRLAPGRAEHQTLAELRGIAARNEGGQIKCGVISSLFR